MDNDFIQDQLAFVLGDKGPFAKKIEHYKVRSSQIEMAEAIADAIQQKQTLLAESGTGTGKTFAYLVPALLSAKSAEKKTLISTGTKHLQDQLYHRDIPLVIEALEFEARVALLKGRSNYLCLHRLLENYSPSKKLDKQQQAEVEVIKSWVSKTTSGDINDLSDIPEDSRIWPLVTSTMDNCIGQSCQYYEDCYVNKARKKATSSDVVVVNHHLFFADQSLKDDGFGALLPEMDTVIFDEAHQLPDTASIFLGESFSSWQVMELNNDVRAAELSEKSLLPKLLPMADALDKLVVDDRLALGLSERREAWDGLLKEYPNFPKKLDTLAAQLSEFADLLEKASVAGEGLARCHKRAQELSQLCYRLGSEQQKDSVVRWVEVARRTFRIHETPLNIGQELNEYFGNSQQTRIFTSATLSINGDFQHFKQLAGLPEKSVIKQWDSPFDYFNQAVLYLPEGLPEPKEDNFSEALFEQVLPVLQASQGGAFVLFTSFRMMRDFEQFLEQYDFVVLMQGQSSKRELLSEFVKKKRAVLLGTMSFWEGVDVPGEALRLVIIDKLPFESPFDPVIKARLKAMQDNGENPFMSYQVPRAVITLRQGAGRLIRNTQDRGVLMICDMRLRNSYYGRLFLDSLPNMRRTRDQQKICGFLSSLVSEKKPKAAE